MGLEYFGKRSDYEKFALRYRAIRSLQLSHDIVAQRCRQREILMFYMTVLKLKYSSSTVNYDKTRIEVLKK